MCRAVPVLNDCMLLAAGRMVSWNIRHSPLSSKQIARLAVNVQWLCIRTSLPCKRSSLKRELRWHQHFNISEDNKIMNWWALNRYSTFWSCKTITICKKSWYPKHAPAITLLKLVHIAVVSFHTVCSTSKPNYRLSYMLDQTKNNKAKWLCARAWACY
jgi:hypothetical protein